MLYVFISSTDKLDNDNTSPLMDNLSNVDPFRSGWVDVTISLLGLPWLIAVLRQDPHRFHSWRHFSLENICGGIQTWIASSCRAENSWTETC